MYYAIIELTGLNGTVKGFSITNQSQKDFLDKMGHVTILVDEMRWDIRQNGMTPWSEGVSPQYTH